MTQKQFAQQVVLLLFFPSSSLFNCDSKKKNKLESNKMLHWNYFCVFVAVIVCAIGSPLPEEKEIPSDLNPIDSQEVESKSSGRQERHGFAYLDGYYNYPNAYYNSYPSDLQYNYHPQQYYPHPAYYPAPASYPNYASSNNIEPAHSLDYQKAHRRRYRPNRFEATSQKYTIWDLARK